MYRNLNKKGKWYSICDTKTGLVIGHSEYIVLTNCRFIVSEAGRQRVLKTGYKNVHSFIEGYYQEPSYENWKLKYGENSPDAYKAQYDPKKWDAFVTIPFENKLTEAETVLLDGTGLTVHSPKFQELVTDKPQEKQKS